MQKSTKSPARGQWASCSYQVMEVRPGVGVHVRTVDPASPLRQKPDYLVNAPRGKVVGFTRHSAQRLRELLFQLDYPENECFGLALTSAPWVCTSPETAFDALRREAPRIPGLRCAVWRKEVTRRGLPHYHAIVWVLPGHSLASVRAALVCRWVHFLTAGRVCPGVAWAVGSRVFNGASDLHAAAQSALTSTNLRPANYTDIARVGAVQYLCDHTSKHKAYQALTTGRAWGVWCRPRLPRLELPGISLQDCPRRLLADLRHALGKMSRYWWPDASAPFGYRWSRPRRFSTGSKVLFRPSAPAVLARLVDAWNARAHESRPASADAAPPRRAAGGNLAPDCNAEPVRGASRGPAHSEA